MCAGPTIYTDELDGIMRRIMETLITDKERIVHDMIKMYFDANMKSSLKEDMAKVQAEINKILSKKDKLLDLSIKGRIDDDEFEARNNQFNSEIAGLKQKTKNISGSGTGTKSLSMTPRFFAV